MILFLSLTSLFGLKWRFEHKSQPPVLVSVCVDIKYCTSYHESRLGYRLVYVALFRADR